MTDLTDAGRSAIADIAQRYGVSFEAAEQMARAVAQGGGAMAQFNIPEFGGGGQWMAGGMTMVGDMFNHGLQAQVAGVCSELAAAMSGAPFFKRPPGAVQPWWPDELGAPASVGGQNEMRYAYFPGARRLVVDPGGGAPFRIYDTGEHQIGGFSQQQSGGGDPLVGLTFSSQFGQFSVTALTPVSPAAAAAPAAEPPSAPSRPDSAVAQFQSQVQSQGAAPRPPEPAAPPLEPAAAPEPKQPAAAAEAERGPGAADILDTIARLAALRDGGALTDEEFAEKKRELLARL